jgi:hypothetical protein
VLSGNNFETATDVARAVLAHGGTVALRGTRLSIEPRELWQALTDDLKEAIRLHRDELKAMVQEGRLPMQVDAPAPRPPLAVEPAAARVVDVRPPLPVVKVRGREPFQLTDEDVELTLRDLGDEAVERYRAGKFDRSEAIAMTVAAVRARLEAGYSAREVRALPRLMWKAFDALGKMRW